MTRAKLELELILRNSIALADPWEGASSEQLNKQYNPNVLSPIKGTWGSRSHFFHAPPSVGIGFFLLFLLFSKGAVGSSTREGKRMGSARHTETFMGLNQDSTSPSSTSVCPGVRRAFRGAEAPAFVAFRAPLRRTQQLSGLGLSC